VPEHGFAAVDAEARQGHMGGVMTPIGREAAGDEIEKDGRGRETGVERPGHRVRTRPAVGPVNGAGVEHRISDGDAGHSGSPSRSIVPDTSRPDAAW